MRFKSCFSPANLCPLPWDCFSHTAEPQTIQLASPQRSGLSQKGPVSVFCHPPTILDFPAICFSTLKGNKVILSFLIKYILGEKRCLHKMLRLALTMQCFVHLAGADLTELRNFHYSCQFQERGLDLPLLLEDPLFLGGQE